MIVFSAINSPPTRPRSKTKREDAIRTVLYKVSTCSQSN